MPLYFIKPIVWNDKNYKQPGGARFTSGYPKQNGFGHEEWNNSDNFEFIEYGESTRIFHSEGFGNQPLDEFPGDIFVFMIASHDGKQYLVGIAGGATSLLSDKNKRLQLLQNIKGGKKRWKDAWKLPSVKGCFGNNEDAFTKKWEEELHWTPTWSCPSELFYWLDEPLLLNPLNISGKARLVTMYSTYQEISRQIASDMLNCIPPGKNDSALENLKARCQTNEFDVATDLTEIKDNDELDVTTREALTQARLGQGKFRKDLMSIWDGGCSVTGCTTEQVLRASHVKPWRIASHKQRLDPQNGLLLVANLDALFDVGLISFEDTGEMLVSNKISKAQRTMLGLPAKLRSKPSDKLCHYLAYHRNTFVSGD